MTLPDRKGIRRKRLIKNFSLGKKIGASIRRDLLLILFGAVISFITSIVTQYFNYHYQYRQRTFERKLFLYDKFSSDIGERLFLSYEFFKSVRDNDSSKISIFYKKYNEKREQYSANQFKYTSSLAIDFGEDMKEKFISTNGTGLNDSIILFGNDIVRQLKPQNTKIPADTLNKIKLKWKKNMTDRYSRLAFRADSLFQILYLRLNK